MSTLGHWRQSAFVPPLTVSVLLDKPIKDNEKLCDLLHSIKTAANLPLTNFNCLGTGMTMTGIDAL
jgi:hypothetical protein